MKCCWPFCLAVLCAAGCASMHAQGRPSLAGPGRDQAPARERAQSPLEKPRSGDRQPPREAPSAVHPNVQPGPRVPVKLGPPRKTPGPQSIPRGVPVAGMQSAQPVRLREISPDADSSAGFSPVRLEPLIVEDDAEESPRPDGVRGYVLVLPPPPPEVAGADPELLRASRFLELPPPLEE